MKKTGIIFSFLLILTFGMRHEAVAAESVLEGEMGDRVWALILEHKPVEEGGMLLAFNNTEGYHTAYRTAIEDIAYWESRDGVPQAKSEYQKQREEKLALAAKAEKELAVKKLSINEKVAFLNQEQSEAAEAEATVAVEKEAVSTERAQLAQDSDETKSSFWPKKSELRKQSFKDFENSSEIDAAVEEAKGAVYTPAVKEEVSEEVKPVTVMTAEEILRQVIKPELRTQKIDLDFDGITLGDLFNTIGETAQMNIVVDPTLKDSPLDLHLKQVIIEEAILLVASTYNLGFDQVGESLFVTRKDRIEAENLVSKIFKLRHVNVTEIEDLIKDLAGTVRISESVNSVIAIGNPDEVAQLGSIIKEIDVPQLQVVLEAKVIEMNKDALREVGIDWSDEIRLGYQEEHRDADFDDEATSPDSTYKVFQLARNPLQFDTTLKALENQNKAKVLAKPSVTTTNGKDAEIFVGDEIPYTITNVTGGVVTTDVRWVEPGIRLNITPSIIDEDFVVIKVEPEVSFIFAFRGPNDEFPHIKSRKATANVRVRNNQPFVIGGLLNQEDKQNLYKVPILGDVPLLGNLFSYENKTAVDTELIITIIPTIVKTE